MSAQAGSEGAAPGAQGPGAGGTTVLTLEHIAKRLEQVETLQRKLGELYERYAEARKRLDIDDVRYPVYVPRMFADTSVRLLYVNIYYFAANIVQQIEAGRLFNDDEWINVRKKLDEFREEIWSNVKRGDPLFETAKGKLYDAYSLLLNASITLKQIRDERDEIDRQLDEMEREILAAEQPRQQVQEQEEEEEQDDEDVEEDEDDEN